MAEEQGAVIACGTRESGDDSGETLDVPNCPTCGEPTTFGFGFAFGGLGPYVCCTREGCNWYRKRQSKE